MTNKILCIALLIALNSCQTKSQSSSDENSSSNSSASLDTSTPFDASQERAILLKNITQIPATGMVGSLILSKNSAFPVLVTAKGKKSVIVGASALGKGKVVAFAHDGYFAEDGVKNAQVCQLIKNSIKWVSNTSKPTILLKDLEDLSNYLKREGFNVKNLKRSDVISPENLKNIGVLIINANRLSNSEIATVKDAIKDGKGGLFCDLGWGWQQLNPDKDLRRENKSNIILQEAGISWSGDAISETSFKAEIEMKDFFSYQDAKKYVLQNDYKKARKTEFSNALSTLLTQIPLMNEKPFAIPSDFPGNAPTNSPTVTKNISIDASIPYWHCTGLYAQSGAKISISTKNIPKSGIKVRIGCHTDELYNAENAEKGGWKRMPAVSIAFDLENGRKDVFNPFGGMIYIEVPEKYKGNIIDFKIEGGVEAPHFKLGSTSLEEWKSKIRNNPAPWGEIEGNEFSFTVESSYLRNLENPEEVAKFWDKVQASNKKLISWDNKKPLKMRLAFDRQISIGYMHSGYPIMALADKAPVDEQANILNLKGRNKWGFVHELGHNHQNESWTFNGTTEVTCNLFSMYAYKNVIRINYADVMEDLNAENMKKAWEKYKAGGKSFDKWKKDPFLALSMYIQLINKYGWGSFEKVFTKYNQLSKAELPKNDNEKRDIWLVMFSQTVGENLSDFFDTWSVPVSQKAKNEIRTLPKADLGDLMKF